jgi:regulator of sigma E protease
MFLLDIAIFILVLGLMVFFHELGHFLAAKACGVYVDRFSLGMPPRVFGMKIGETDYCVGALPLGGYVKMAGQEDTPLSEEEREQTYGHVPEHRWFNKRPVWQRIIIIVSGPLMNMVLAVLLYGVVAALGAEVRESDVDSRIGQVAENSPASTAPMYAIAADGAAPVIDGTPDAEGWKTGDRIVTINDQKIRNIMDVGIDAVLGGGAVMNVVVERSNPDGSKTRYLSPVQPKQIGDEAKDKRLRFGVSPFDAAFVAGVNDKSPAQAIGLQKNDEILRANGKTVDGPGFVQLIEKTPEGENVALDVLRGSDTVSLSVKPETIGRIQGLDIWSSYDGNEKLDEQAEPVVAQASSEATKETKLKAKDIIKTINGAPATIALLRDFEKNHPGETAEITVDRPAILHGLLRKQESFDTKISVASVRAIGVQLGAKMIFRRVPPAQVVPEAFNLTYQALERTVRTLEMLVTGGLSPKELGGPVMIYQITTQAAHVGYSWLLNITAFISVNLCVFNLLPLPILDGSLLVYFTLEGIRRKPLDMRILERIQQVGMVMIIGLLLYVTFNDVSRWVNNLVP